jgi:hypothetical protein
MYGETPTDLRMGAPAPTTNFDGLAVTQTQRKAAIDSPYHSGREARALEDWLEARPWRSAMLGINADSCNGVVWVTSYFSGTLSIWWLNRKH